MTIAETVHETCVTARRECPCTWCGAQPGRACDCPGGIHLRRIITARLAGCISGPETDEVFHYTGALTESVIVPDAGGITA